MKLIYVLSFIFAMILVNGQTNLRINKNIILPPDSSENMALIKALNNFLVSAQKPNEENNQIFESEKIETFILLDEVKGIEKSGKYKDDYFYKPYLTNIVLLNKDNYFIQVSYIGMKDTTCFLRASFEFIAYKKENSFVFSSPLLLNTKNWKTEKSGNTTIHYQMRINKMKKKEFFQLISIFNKKLKSADKICDYYCCSTLTELEKLIGVAYKSDYNSKTESAWSAKSGDKKVIVLGNKNAEFENVDPHDLWHDRLGLVVARNKVNHSVDEACAYLYGGSWGISWQEILKTFKKKVATDKSINWMEVKEKPLNFGDSEKQPLMADYVINALLIKKIESEKGFSAVWELLNSGKEEEGNYSYYIALEKLIGISKANYNERVWELINKEK